MTTIPHIDAAKLRARDPETLVQLRIAAQDVGFMTLENSAIPASEVLRVIDAYRRFFHLPETDKARVDMARTGSNRGWGAAFSEQVDPEANPDYKQVFDCGFELPANDPLAAHPFYAPNIWPEAPADFRALIEGYATSAMQVALETLQGILSAIGQDPHQFDDSFAKPMALLRGNYYPSRPANAGAKDFGIAPHTDYGCITLLATDGVSGLEVLSRDDQWISVDAKPGTFVINFGEMLESWTNGAIRATLHRVIGSQEERISVPLFFNPAFDTNVAPLGSGQVQLAGDHLSKRYNETYIHLNKAP